MKNNWFVHLRGITIAHVFKSPMTTKYHPHIVVDYHRLIQHSLGYSCVTRRKQGTLHKHLQENIKTLCNEKTYFTKWPEASYNCCKCMAETIKAD